MILSVFWRPWLVLGLNGGFKPAGQNATLLTRQTKRRYNQKMVNVQREAIELCMHAGGFYARKKCTPRATLASSPGNSLYQRDMNVCALAVHVPCLVWPMWSSQLLNSFVSTPWQLNGHLEHGGTDWLLGDPCVTRYLCNSMSLTNYITQNIVILNHLENSRCTRWCKTPKNILSCLLLSLIHGIYCASFYPRKKNFKSRNITLKFESMHEIPSNGNSIER